MDQPRTVTEKLESQVCSKGTLREGTGGVDVTSEVQESNFLKWLVKKSILNIYSEDEGEGP